jgi:hypothetical protein
MLVEWGPLTKKGKVELRLSDLLPRQLQLPDKWRAYEPVNTEKCCRMSSRDIADLVESQT